VPRFQIEYKHRTISFTSMRSTGWNRRRTSVSDCTIEVICKSDARSVFVKVSWPILMPVLVLIRARKRLPR
jgi:hypothetical protein